jgi:Calcium-binding EGF domain
VAHINRELQGVMDVEVEWKGSDFWKVNHDHHHHHHHSMIRVGEHMIQCKVTRSVPSSSTTLSSTSMDNNDDDEYPHQVRDKEHNETQQPNDDMLSLTTTECYHIPFTITDTNECFLPNDHPMKHQCDIHSTICVNTIGSYECICPRILQQEQNDQHHHHYQQQQQQQQQQDNEHHGNHDPNQIQFGMTITDPIAFFTLLHDNHSNDRTPWELSYKSISQSSCPYQPSTFGCCEDYHHPTSHPTTTSSSTSSSSSSCRAQFHCPIDPCSQPEYNDCSSHATCVRKVTPSIRKVIPSSSTVTATTTNHHQHHHPHHREYTCKCPLGYMGNGYQCQKDDAIPQPKLKYDGITPTDDTIKHHMYCDCTIPIIDPCDGYTSCTGTCYIVPPHL